MTNEIQKTKEERLLEYIKLMKAYDVQIADVKEAKKETKESFIENNWLDKDEIKLAMKILKLVEDDVDLLDVERVWKIVEKS